MSYGMSNVMFSWLVAIVLQESPTMVGVAQMAILVPATIFMLLGGSLSDHVGARRVAVVSQGLAVLPLLMLATVLWFDLLSFGLILVYAVSIGTLQAFVTPSRDAILNSVARGDIQRTVVKFTLVQFSMQMCGFILAGSAQTIGGTPIVLIQAIVVGIGAWSLSRVPQVAKHTQSDYVLSRDVASSIVEGCKTVLRDPAMRAVVLQNISVGICFVGSFTVTIPLLIRDVYMGSSFDIALIYLINSTGLVCTIVLLLFAERLRRPGRALLLAHGLGAIVLGFAGTGVPFIGFAVLLFCWGTCGGVAMSMGRTVMLENAPEGLRGRVMGFYSFSFMGSGPIGALLWGVTAEFVGPGMALIFASSLMFLVVASLGVRSKLWRMTHPRISDSIV